MVGGGRSQQHQLLFCTLVATEFPWVSIVFSETDIECLRQQEAAFFRLCEPWSSRSERENLGIANILKWSLRDYEPLSRLWFQQLLEELLRFITTYSARRPAILEVGHISIHCDLHHFFCNSVVLSRTSCTVVIVATSGQDCRILIDSFCVQ